MIVYLELTEHYPACHRCYERHPNPKQVSLILLMTNTFLNKNIHNTINTMRKKQNVHRKQAIHLLTRWPLNLILLHLWLVCGFFLQLRSSFKQAFSKKKSSKPQSSHDEMEEMTDSSLPSSPKLQHTNRQTSTTQPLRSSPSTTEWVHTHTWPPKHLSFYPRLRELMYTTLSKWCIKMTGFVIFILQ